MLRNLPLKEHPFRKGNSPKLLLIKIPSLFSRCMMASNFSKSTLLYDLVSDLVPPHLAFSRDCD